jgi:hypothetical protein
VLQKTGYADFDGSEDNTDATAKLEDKEVRKVRKRHLACFATLFLITNLYGILREYCYPHSKMRDSLPMNTLFRFAMEYVVCHASILVYPMDLSNLDHNLGFSGSATRNPNDLAVLDLTADPPQRLEGEQQSNVPPPTAKAPTGPSLKKDPSVADALTFDGLYDSSASGSAPTAITNDGDLKIAASPPCTLTPKVVESPFKRPSRSRRNLPHNCLVTSFQPYLYSRQPRSIGMSRFCVLRISNKHLVSLNTSTLAKRNSKSQRAVLS